MELKAKEVEKEAKARDQAFSLAQQEGDSEQHQVQGLMTAAESLHRIGEAFKPKPKSD